MARITEITLSTGGDCFEQYCVYRMQLCQMAWNCWECIGEIGIIWNDIQWIGLEDVGSSLCPDKTLGLWIGWTWFFVNQDVTSNVKNQPKKVTEIITAVVWMSAWRLCSGCFNPQCRSAVYWKNLDKEGAAAAAEHDITISLPLIFPVRFLSLTPPEFPCPSFIPYSNSFFLKLWHHPVWAVVALLSSASRWQLWLMERGCCWKNPCTHRMRSSFWKTYSHS